MPDPRVLAENWCHDNLEPEEYEEPALLERFVDVFVAGWKAADLAERGRS